MKILIIGGTGFIGPYLARELAQRGHSVAVLHRGNSHPDLPVEHILGDCRNLARLRPNADVVIDLILSSGNQAKELMGAYRGVARAYHSWGSAVRIATARHICSGLGIGPQRNKDALAHWGDGRPPAVERLLAVLLRRRLLSRRFAL